MLSKRRIAAAVTGLALGLLAMAAWSQLPGPTPLEPETGAPREEAAACRERTNGCVICRRDATGAEHCSLPGIACQPSGWRCITSSVQPFDSPQRDQPRLQ